MSAPHLGQVGRVRIGRNKFNISNSILGNVKFGDLIPVWCEPMIPSDVFKFSHEAVIRMQTLLFPVLQQIDAKIYTFFIPYRILDEAWEQRITGGERGEYTEDDTLPFPKWKPPPHAIGNTFTLWDYFGFPTIELNPNIYASLDNKDCLPLAYFPLGYYLVWDEYFRDEWLQDKVFTKKLAISNTYYTEPLDLVYPLKKNYKKDYFTAALPEPYKGSTPALPIAGTTKAVFNYNVSDFPPPNDVNLLGRGYASTTLPMQSRVGVSPSPIGSTSAGTFTTKDILDQNTINLNTASTFDPNDLRAIMQTYKWLERNARIGSRYIESLIGRFDVQPQDMRLQRPEFIGSTTVPIIISEVLQTGQPTQTSDRPQGDMAGHGIAATKTKQFKYKAQEHGFILSVMAIEPKRQYVMGIDRKYTPNNLYDMPFPEFTHLGEREIKNGEIYFTGTNDDSGVWGFRGIYDEYRYGLNRVCGEMRLDTELGAWSLLEIYQNRPELNSDFISISNNKLNNIFAVKEGFIYHINNNCTAYRPLPIIAEPGLIDHF